MADAGRVAVPAERGEATTAHLAARVNDLLVQLWLAADQDGPDFEDFPLTGQQHSVLTLVARAPGVAPHRLAEEMGVSRGAISQHLAALERDGYVERRRSGVDRRATVVDVVGRGVEYRRRLVEFERRAADVYAARLSRDDLLEVVAALTKLAGAFARPSAATPTG